MNGSPYKSRETDDASARSCLQSIRRIVQLLRVASRESEKRAGLSGAQLFVLQKLRDGGGTQSLNELAQRTLTHQSSVSVVVQRLVEQGLVSRVRGKHDARRIELSLTPAARGKIRRAPESAAQDRLLAGLEKLSASK